MHKSKPGPLFFLYHVSETRQEAEKIEQEYSPYAWHRAANILEIIKILQTHERVKLHVKANNVAKTRERAKILQKMRARLNA